MLITLLRHCDRVTSACLAQLVNTIAPIRTEPAGASWRQTIFYPAFTARHAKGDVLRAEPKAPTYHSSAYGDARHRCNRNPGPWKAAIPSSRSTVISASRCVYG